MRKTDRKNRRQKLLRRKEVRTVEVPVFPGHKDGPTFSLVYTDSGVQDGQPTLVVIPGGPGFASVLPYAFYRPRIARAGFRAMMVEHRGVGLSRRDAEGEDLPVEAMRVEYAARDVVAVLDHLGVNKAWLHGTSYGGYLAQAVGVIAPERVAGMFLDTPMHSSKDEEELRDHNRRLFFCGESPRTAKIAEKVRSILDRGLATDAELTAVVPPVYELAGPRAVERLLDLVVSGRRAEWNFLRRRFEGELNDDPEPFIFEFDLAGTIWYRQLVPPIADGRPFDTSKMFADKAKDFPAFEGEPYDMEDALWRFDWPVVLLSGERDTRVPVFLVRKMEALLPRALHVTFPNAGHDLFRFRNKAVLAIEAAAVRGGLEEARAVAREETTGGGWHPQHGVARATEGYLALVEAAMRPGTRRGVVAALAVVALAALVWRTSRRPS